MAITDTIRRIVSWFRRDDSATSEVTPAKAPQAGFALSASTGVYDTFLQHKTDRLSKLRDYDLMDEMSPECSQAASIYADNAVYGDHKNESYKIKFTGPKSQEAMEAWDLFVTESDFDSKLWNMCRDIIKYGEDFAEPIISEKSGLIETKFLPPHTMWIEIDEFGKAKDPNRYFVQRADDDKMIATWPQESLLHTKILGDRRSPYGRSLFYSARGLFHKLSNMEDAMVMARLKRAHSRYIYQVDTQGLPLPLKIQALENAKERYRTARMMDPTSGLLRQEQTPMRTEDDLFIGSDDKVDVLEGDLSLSNIQDVEFFLGKLYTCLGVPKSYLARDESVNSKNTLSQQDIQFARTVRRVQLAMRSGIKRLAIICLLSRGIDPSNIRMDITFPYLSAVDAHMFWETMMIKASVAALLRTQLGDMFPVDWIYTMCFDYQETEIGIIKDLLKQQNKDQLILPPGLIPDPIDNDNKELLPAAGASILQKTLGKSMNKNNSAESANFGDLNFNLISEAMNTNPAVRDTLARLNMLVNWRLEAIDNKERNSEEN